MVVNFSNLLLYLNLLSEVFVDILGNSLCDKLVINKEFLNGCFITLLLL